MDAIYFTGYEQQLVLINHSCNHIAERHVIQRGGKGPINKKKNSEKLHNDFTHFDSLSKIC